MPHDFRRAAARVVAALCGLMVVSGCTVVSAPEPLPEGDAPTTVVVVTHDSWALPKKLIADFEADTGYDVVIRRSGDAGALTNRLVLSKDNPTADVVFGIDNTFASRALDEGVLAAHDVTLPDGAAAFNLAEGADRLVPVDTGNVCVNVDTTWFAERSLPEPTSFEDLADPRYRGLLVAPAPTTSSPGLAFLWATIHTYGDDWPAYWERLVANDVALTAGWSDAYFVDFTQGGGGGDRPLVVSYDSSPAFTLTADGESSTTRALLDTCLRQVEYAGVIAGAANPDGAEAFLEFLLSESVQAALPNAMYVFPVRAGVELPADWAEYAVRPTAPIVPDPAELDANREDWLQTWTDLTS